MMYIFNVLYRGISGAQNGAAYGNNNIGVLGATVLALLTIGWFGVYTNNFTWLYAIPALCAILQVIWFNTKNGNKKIHWTELIGTTAFSILCFFEDWVATIASMYPSYVAHKISVNILQGNNWNYNGTDDPTGDTVGYPLPKWLKFLEGKNILGWTVPETIKVPRFTMKTRIIIGAITTAAYLIYLIVK